MIRIVMCVFNGEKYIREQINSIIENTVTDWKLYISDDGSTDLTETIIEEYSRQYPNKFVYEKHSHKNGAAKHFLEKIRSVGVEMQEDDVIMLADQDDVWDKDKIERTLRAMGEMVISYGNQVPLLVCTNVRVVDEEQKLIHSSFLDMNHYDMNKMDLAYLLMENKVQGCTSMLNKPLVNKITDVPENLRMHDAWIGLIASAFGHIKYLEQPSMSYRIHSNNVQGTDGFYKIIWNQIKQLSDQKYIVYSGAKQAEELMQFYGADLNTYQKKVIASFISLQNDGFWKKRYHLFQYHLWKSGIIRNLGMLVLL